MQQCSSRLISRLADRRAGQASVGLQDLPTFSLPSLQSPPYTSSDSFLPDKPEPVVVGGQTFYPQQLPQGPDQTSLYFYDLPTTSAQNPTPDLRYDQEIALLQQVLPRACPGRHSSSCLYLRHEVQLTVQLRSRR